MSPPTFYCSLCQCTVSTSWDNEVTKKNLAIHIFGNNHSGLVYNNSPGSLSCGICNCKIRSSFNNDVSIKNLKVHVDGRRHCGNVSLNEEETVEEDNYAPDNGYVCFFCSLCNEGIFTSYDCDDTIDALQCHLISFNHKNKLNGYRPGYMICSLCEYKIPNSENLESSNRNVINHVLGPKHKNKLPLNNNNSSSSCDLSEFESSYSYRKYCRRY